MLKSEKLKNREETNARKIRENDMGDKKKYLRNTRLTPQMKAKLVPYIMQPDMNNWIWSKLLHFGALMSISGVLTDLLLYIMLQSMF